MIIFSFLFLYLAEVEELFKTFKTVFNTSLNWPEILDLQLMITSNSEYLVNTNISTRKILASHASFSLSGQIVKNIKYKLYLGTVLYRIPGSTDIF